MFPSAMDRPDPAPTAAGRIRTAFVFAGGGSLGAIQVGMLRELLNAGERPDMVVGASVGALNAAFFAGRPDAKGVAALEAIWRKLRRRDVFPITARGLLGWIGGAGSLFEPSGLRRLIETHLPFRTLEDAAIPLHVVATNLGGVAVTLSRGPVVDAILASSAIPIAFPSVQIGTDHLMDGAIGGNTPILSAAQLDATRIIVLPTGFACSMDAPPRAALARGMHAITLLVAHQIVRDLRHLAGTIQVYTVPSLCPLDVSPFNFDHAEALIERAARATRQWLQAGGLSDPSVPMSLLAHAH